jgi:multiple sugar transport system permease protein
MARTVNRLFVYAFLAGAIIFALFPIWWMVVTSLKSGPELFSDANPLWPHYPTLENYRYLLSATEFRHWLLNSMLVCSISTLFALLLAVPAAYSIAKVPSFHSRSFGFLAILGYGLPPILLLVPMFVFATGAGVYDRAWVLPLVYPSFLVPFATWLTAGFMKSVPFSVEDAARIDGCSRFGVLIYVMLPSIKRGLVSTVVFCFLLSWGEYVYAMGLVASQDLRTLPVGISSLESGDVFQWGAIMAAAVLANIPVILLLAISRRTLARGLTVGALKR